jgi:hypothetical protein
VNLRAYRTPVEVNSNAASTGVLMKKTLIVAATMLAFGSVS